MGTIQSGAMLENGACMRNFLEKCRQRVKALRDNGLRIFQEKSETFLLFLFLFSRITILLHIQVFRFLEKQSDIMYTMNVNYRNGGGRV